MNCYELLCAVFHHATLFTHCCKLISGSSSPALNLLAIEADFFFSSFNLRLVFYKLTKKVLSSAVIVATETWRWYKLLFDFYNWHSWKMIFNGAKESMYLQ